MAVRLNGQSERLMLCCRPGHCVAGRQTARAPASHEALRGLAAANDELKAKLQAQEALGCRVSPSYIKGDQADSEA